MNSSATDECDGAAPADAANNFYRPAERALPHHLKNGAGGGECSRLISNSPTIVLLQQSSSAPPQVLEPGCKLHCDEAVEKRLMSQIDTQSDCASVTDDKAQDAFRYGVAVDLKWCK